LSRNRTGGVILGVEAVSERHPAFRLLPLRCPKPGVEFLAQRRHHRAGWPGPRLHKVDILGVAGGRLEMKLVERRPAPERESVAQERVREDLDERSADHQVLLDLEVLDPRRL
jgi:hypothetical protein